MYNEPADSIWVRIRGQISMGDTVVGGYYRSPDQEEEVHKVFFRQLEEASRSLALALALMGYWNHVKCLLAGQHSRAQAVEQFSGAY